MADQPLSNTPFEDTALLEAQVPSPEQGAGTFEPEAVLSRLVALAVELSEAEAGVVVLRDDETGELYGRAVSGLTEIEARAFRQTAAADAVAGQVLATGRPVLMGEEDRAGEPIELRPNYRARARLYVPLTHEDRLYGVLAVYQGRNSQAFTQNHLARLTPLAGFAAVAVENARRFQHTHQLLGDAFALFDIAELFTETLELDELLYLIAGQTLGRLEPVDRVVIHLYNANTKRLERKVRMPPVENEPQEGRGFAVGHGIAGRVVLENRPINVPDVDQEPGFEARDLKGGSLLVAPISKRRVPIGTISVASPVVNAFQHRDERFLTSLADLAALAIENARLFEAERARARQLKVVAELAEKLTQILHLDELLQQTVSLIHETFDFDDVALKLYDPEVDGLVFKVSAGRHAAHFDRKQVQKFGEGLVGWAAQTGQTALANDVGQNPHYVSHGLRGTKSELDVPLKYHDEVIGVLNVQSQSLNAFGRHDVIALEALADQIAVAIENARLYALQGQLIKESQDRLEVVERRNNELNSLRHILAALQSTLSLPEVLSRIVNGVVAGLNYRAVVISTVDEANQLLQVQEVAVESDPALRGLLEPRQRQAKETQQALIGNSVSLVDHKTNLGIRVCLDGRARVTHSLYDISRPIVGREMCRLLQDMFLLTSFIVLPIRTEERLFGVLYAGTQREEISAADLGALQGFADQAALAIRNARQFEDMHGRLRRRVREMQGLQTIDRLISSTPDLEAMLQNILDVARKLVGVAGCGSIALTDRDSGKLIPRVSYPEGSVAVEGYVPGLAAWAAQARETARVPDMSLTPWAKTYGDLNVRSELAAPILVGEELVGVINIGSSKPDAFNEEDESLLDILATQAAAAIQTGRYYQELAESRLRQSEAERLAAMSDIAGNMVHRINNSTGAIRVLVQQIRRSLDNETMTPEILAKKLDSIEDSAARTLALARSIRNPFNYQPTELIEVEACLGHALERLRPLPATIDLKFELEAGLPLVMVTQQLREVFRNLIKNAVEAMDAAGTITITGRLAGRFVEVTVTDSGPGIPTDLTTASIFNLGTSSKKDGLGYGLWWCHVYLNRIGGSIELDQRFQAGCRFVVKLPPEVIQS